MPGADDFSLLLDAVRAAGALSLRMQAAGFGQSNKPDGSLVTDVDLAVNDLLLERLSTTRPSYGWLSEETPDDPARMQAEKTWIVDPIDGTRSFAQRRTNWCIGVALVHRGVPIISAVYHPAIERFYHGIAGGGAYLNGVRLMIADGESLAGARVMGASRLVKPLERKGVENVPTQDTALLARMAMVAGGELEAAVALGPKYDWDLAAGALLVTESGGIITGLDGRPYHFNRESRCQPGLVAANASRHKAILKILETA